MELTPSTQKIMYWKWLFFALVFLIIGFAGGWFGHGFIHNCTRNILEQPVVTCDSSIIVPTDTTINTIESRDTIDYEQ